MGAITPVALRTYPDGFPEEVIEQLVDGTGRGVLCNVPYSGTAVIDDYGEEHLRTGHLIVYTSADSVLQIAAHEDEVPQAELVAACQVGPRDHARRACGRPGHRAPVPRHARPLRAHGGPQGPRAGPARPHLPRRAPRGRRPDAHGGQDRLGLQPRRRRPRAPGRDQSRRDRGDEPADRRARARLRLHQPGGDRPGLRPPPGRAGLPRRAPPHRRRGRRRGSEQLDPERDLLVITADHGCDPTTPGTDHTREHVPLLAAFAGHGGRRHDGPFADVGASVLRWLAGREADALPGAPFL